MLSSRPLAALAALLVLAGCSASALRGSDMTPEGPTWRLVAFGDGTAPAGEITVSFADGGLSGSAGCNRYFGGYVRDGAELATSDIGSTRRMCEPPLMEQERRFLDAMQEATRWAEQGDRLALSDVAGDVLLQFERAGASGDASDEPSGGMRP